MNICKLKGYNDEEYQSLADTEKLLYLYYRNINNDDFYIIDAIEDLIGHERYKAIIKLATSDRVDE